MLACKQPGLNSPWQSYHQISLSPRAARPTRSSILRGGSLVLSRIFRDKVKLKNLEVFQKSMSSTPPVYFFSGIALS